MQALPTENAEVPGGPQIDLKKALPWIIYLVFFGVLNETVFNVSTPEVSKAFSLSPTGVSWMMTIFIIFFGIGSVIYGRLSDIFSLRNLIRLGVAIYCLGSVLGFGFQFSYPVILVGRALQGAGASAIPALIMVIVARYVAVNKRGKVFGTIGSTVAFALGIGPVLGGFISSTLGWTFLLLIPLFTLVALPFFAVLLPKEERRPGGVDVLGAVLVALGVGSLVVYLTYPEWYYLAASAALFGLFVVRILRVRNPFIEPALFKNSLFRDGLIVGFILFSTVMGIFFVIPLMLSSTKGLNTGEIGLLLFPGAMSAVVCGPLSGNLADKKGNRFVITIGLGFLVLSLGLLAFFLSSPVWVLSGIMLLNYVGFSFLQTGLINSVSQTLHANETGVGMGLFNLTTFISGAVGTALVAKIVDGKWFDRAFIPFFERGAFLSYNNIFIVFSLLIVLGGLLYYRAYRGKRIGEPEEPQGCVEC